MQDERLSVGPYLIERSDYKALSRAIRWGVIDYINGTLTCAFRASGIVFLGYVVARISFTQFMSVNEFQSLRILPIGGAGLVALFDLLVLQSYFAGRAFRMQRYNVRKQIISISSAELECLSDDIKATVPWHEIDRVVVTGKHIFLFLAPALAYIIPTRAFASNEAAKLFGEKAGAWCDGAKAARRA